MYYDKKAQIVWVRLESSIVNVGPITGLSAMVPTEKGFIQVSGYSLRNDFATHEATFRSVAVSVAPEPSLVYRPHWSDSLPSAVSGTDWGKLLERGIEGAVVGGAVALIVGLKRRKKK
jgi:hypothetical protein